MLHMEPNMQTIDRQVRHAFLAIALALAVPGSAGATPVPTLNPGALPSAGLPGIAKPKIPGSGSPSLKPPASADGSTKGADTSGGKAPEAPDASDEEEEEEETATEEKSSASTFAPPRQKPPILDPNAKIMIDFVNKPIMDLIKYMAELTGRNFILTDDIKGDITIISHKPVTVPAAYEAFLSALEQTGYTTVTVGNVTKVVSSNVAGKTPIRVHHNSNIPFTDNFVTQIIELENVSVGDISSVVKELMSKDASVISYAPANTLILTDAATNIRKIYRIINQLDIAAPKARLNVVPLSHAQAAEVQKIIQDLYGTASSGTSSGSSAADERRARRRSRLRDRVSAKKGGSSTSVGSEGKYIEKIIADERTNSLIVMANDEAMTAVLNLIAELDVDVDPSSRAQIHVVYLEHAKSEEVASVLSNLAQTGGSKDSRTSAARRRAAAQRAKSTRGAASGATTAATATGDSTGGASAAFEDGVRITSDENTNSLVIIATQDQFAILKAVIEKLDIRRRQVFVEAVVLEIGSDDELNVGLGVHMGNIDSNGSLSLGSGQFNGSSMGLSQDVLSGMAVGIYGKPIDIEVASPLDGSMTTMSVPAFGIALNAMQGDSSVNILSTPNILTMDNEEAKIVVGKNVPFKAGSSMSGTGTTIQNITREDVGLTLKVTPQINESRFVTLEVFQEVQELQESADSDLGPTTSKRSAETTVVVRDNQTVVIGGLIGSTETESETKVPILGDLPLIGMFFRGRRAISSKTNMMIFLTPHIIEDPEDLEEVYRIKWAQRQAYIKRFYGKSRDKADAALQQLLQYSMNQIDTPSVYRTKVPSATEAAGFTTIGAEAPNVNPIDPATVIPEPVRPEPATSEPLLDTEETD